MNYDMWTQLMMLKDYKMAQDIIKMLEGIKKKTDKDTEDLIDMLEIKQFLLIMIDGYKTDGVST